MSWKDAILGELIALQRGYDLPSDNRVYGEIPIIGSAGITGFHNEAKVFGGGITVGRSGNSFGKVYRCKEDFWPHNASLYVKENYGNNIDYLYYFLRNIDFTNYNSGSAQPSLNRNFIYPIKIKIPPLSTQKRIASILSAYDDSIENNLKRIKLLEETAQNIYKEWFVQFRFPNYENTAFDEVSGLPVGWEMKTINDFGNVITGKTPSTANANFYGGTIPFVKTPDMHDAPYVLETSISLTNEGAEIQSNKYLPKNSVLVSCIGTAGVVSLTSEICQTNQQINAVKFDEEYKSFYFYGFARGLKSLLEGLGSNGATMVNVNKSKFENIPLLVPDVDILIKYDKSIKFFFEQVLVLQQQNQKLKEARDILLPRLMNRTIEV